MHAPARRSILVMDPKKLSYFARANAIRAGSMNTYGALAGVRGFGETTAWEEAQAIEAEKEFAARQAQEAGNLFTGGAATGAGEGPATGANTKATGLQFVDAAVTKLNELFSPRPPPTVAAANFSSPSPWPLVLGGVALLAGGVLVFKMMKKR